MPATLKDVKTLLFSESPPEIGEPLIGPVSVTSAKVVHGRGLVATRNIAPGECLFVTPPTVSAPFKDVARIYAGGKRSMEEISETILLKNMKRALKQKPQQAASFMFLTTAKGTPVAPTSVSMEDRVKICLGQMVPKGIWWDASAVDDSMLLDIIRHNAFGPDFHNYAQMEENFSTSKSAYHRILGMYPLAAIINHSCHPNAIRVFSGEVMIVHASEHIKEGEEIVWSYIPAIHPYECRQEQLRRKFDFPCKCQRCRVEDEIRANIRDTLLPLSTKPQQRGFGAESRLNLLESVLSNSSLSNEQRWYIQVGHTRIIMNFINETMYRTKQDEIQKLAMKLHLAFCATYNASTEHLSVLHLCYDLAHSDKRSFWVEQLKRAHLVRYGELGHDLETVRSAMQHTKGVLRSLNGMQNRRFPFV